MSGIYIPEPCHENWNGMTPTEKGRFCSVCTKEVVDFSKKSHQDIIQHLQQAEGKTCGQFLVTQLDDSLQNKYGKNVWMYRSKKILVSFLAFLGVFGLSKNAKAQKMGKVAIRGDVAYNESHNTTTSTTTINGQVVDGGGKGLAKVNVNVYSNSVLIASTETMANGTYTLKIAPGKIEMNKITVTVDHFNYASKSVTDLQITKSSHRINFSMEEEFMMLGEVYWQPDDTLNEETIEPIIEDTLVIKSGCSAAPLDTLVNLEPIHLIKGQIAVIEPIKVIPQTQDTTSHEESLPSGKEFQTTEVREEDVNGKLYPNPGKERVNLVMNEKSNYSIEVVSLIGQVVASESFTGSLHIIDVSRFTPGVYIVKYNDSKSGKNGSLRLVKE